MSGRHNDLTDNLTKNLVLEGETLFRTVGHTSHQGAERFSTTTPDRFKHANNVASGVAKMGHRFFNTETSSRNRLFSLVITHNSRY
jgi:hypothetical protein